MDMAVSAGEQAHNKRGRADHLKPYQYKPGQSGNPDGRPQGSSITARLRKLLEKDVSGKVLAEILAEVAAKEAAKGNYQFFREILDRTEGKVVERVQQMGPMNARELIGEMDGITAPSNTTGAMEQSRPVRGGPGGQAEREDGTGEEAAGEMPADSEAVE